jgi:uncharacterized membrane protein
LITRRPQLEDTLGIAFDQVRHYGAENPTVAIALTRLLGRLAATAPAQARPAFIQALYELKATAEARITDAVDRRRYDAAAEDALRIAAGENRTRIEAGGD